MTLTRGSHHGLKDFENGMQHFSDSSSSMRVLSSKMSKSSNNKAGGIAKRRSRASKTTPVTKLSANASNFRALVQQFTGCPTTPLSLGDPFKGPITLNFKRGIREMQTHLHNNNTPTSYDDDNNNNQVLCVRFHQNHHQQQIQSQVLDHHHEVQKINVVDDDGDGDDDDCVIMEKVTSTSGDSSSSSLSVCGLEVSHDLTTADFEGLMEDFSLQDLIDMDNDLSFFV